MPSLSGSDYRKALAVLREAGDVEGPIPFPRPVLAALRRLVACDVVTYHEQIDCLGQADLVFTGEPGGPMTPTIREAAKRYRHQDPLVPVDGARKYSDYLSRRDYRRLDLYHEADRPLGIEYMMRLWLDPTGAGGARLEFDRASRDFGERDRAVLDLVLPHLQRFRVSAARRRWLSVRPRNRAARLTKREQEILRRVAGGRTNAEIAWSLQISPQTVRKHLENAYEKLGVHTRTAAVAALFDLETHDA
jgi:DNA-binding CsgD family transcriptional regulator